MAQFQQVEVGELDPGTIIVPERYDLRRNSKWIKGKRLYTIVDLINDQVEPNRLTAPGAFILDTGDAKEGFILLPRRTDGKLSTKSSKKVIKRGDIVISRLRPYLRQVALVDGGIFDEVRDLFCSTEFYVLRRKDKQSIAFLVPFLLSSPVQRIFALSQEGGHHPRFRQETLEQLEVPSSILDHREALSASVEISVRGIRDSMRTIEGLVASSERALTTRSNQPPDKSVEDT